MKFIQIIWLLAFILTIFLNINVSAKSHHQVSARDQCKSKFYCTRRIKSHEICKRWRRVKKVCQKGHNVDDNEQLDYHPPLDKNELELILMKDIFDVHNGEEPEIEDINIEDVDKDISEDEEPQSYVQIGTRVMIAAPVICGANQYPDMQGKCRAAW